MPFEKMIRVPGARTVILIALAALASAGVAFAQQAVGPQQGSPQWTQSQRPELKPVPARPLDLEVARMGDGESITVGDLVDYYRYWRNVGNVANVPADQIPTMPSDWLEHVAQSLALGRYYSREVEAIASPEERARYEEEFESYLLNYAIEELLDRRITSRVVAPTDEEVAAYYEQHKIEYYQPFQFHMRYIFMMTYQPYTVRAGDNLKLIAEKISGDPSKFDQIRADVPTRPVRWAPPEQRDKKLYKEIEVGEKLLVPMNEQRAAAVKERLEGVLARRSETTTFEQLAAQHSEAASKGQITGPLPSGLRPIVGGLLEAGRQTEVGEISPIFRTKHGWQVIEVTDKEQEGYQSLDDVQAEITEILSERQRKELDSELAEELRSLETFTIDMDAFGRAPNLADDAVMSRVGAKTFTWATIKAAGEQELSQGGSEPAIREFLARFPPIQYALTLEWCLENGVFAEGERKKTYDNVRLGSFAKSRLNSRVRAAQDAAATPQKVEDYYQANKAQLYTLPATISYVVVERRPGDSQFSGKSQRERDDILKNMVKDLNKELDGIDNIDGFVSLAERTNVKPVAGKPSTQLIGSPLIASDLDLRLLSGPTGDQAASLRIGRFSKAYIEEGQVRAVGLTNLTESRVQTLDEAREDVAQRLRTAEGMKAFRSIPNEDLAAAGFEFLLEPGK